MSRLARSWQMTKTSFGVVKQDPELMWMPILSFLASAIAIAGVLGLGFVAGVFPDPTRADGSYDPVATALSLASYVVLAFIQVYFHAATVAGAHERLAGGDPTVGSALRKANRHLGRLFLWSLVVATVNIILQALRNLASRSRLPIDDIIVGMVGIAWNLATYFVVPILIFEDAGIGSGFKRSGAYFKRTWGESLVGEYGIGFAGTLVTIAILIVGGILTIYIGGALGLAGIVFFGALTLIAVVLTMILFSVAAAVYKTALYRFASEGHAGGPFDDGQLAQAYRRV